MQTARLWWLVECKNSKQTGAFRQIIDNFHSYMKYKDTCNRRINWLVYYRGNLVGAFGVNSALLRLGARDTFIGWTDKQRMSKLNNLANNYRFCLSVRGLPTSQLLSVATKVAQSRWEEKYKDRLILIESLVKPPYQGTVYKAAGWVLVGKTKGYSMSKAPLSSWQKEKSKRGELARRDPQAAIRKYAVGGIKVKVTRSEPKLIFVRPLIPKWKEALLGD